MGKRLSLGSEVGKGRSFQMMSNKASQHHYEHLLFGCVTEAELQPLLHRLRGLCDYATTGGVPFLDREVGYKIGRVTSSWPSCASLTWSICFCRSW